MKLYIFMLLLLASTLTTDSFILGLKEFVWGTKGDKNHWVNDEKPWFCHDLDCPKFSLVKEFTSNGIKIQERCYEKTEWVSTDMTGPHKSSIQFKSMFQKLFKYISGQNDRKEKVKMTAPVLMQVSMDKTKKETLDLRMNFFVPPEQVDTLPNPSAADVKITSVPTMCVYVRWYGGWQMGLNSKMHTKVQELRSALKASGLEGQYDEQSMMFAGYDSPWRLFNRHNEVMVKKLDN